LLPLHVATGRGHAEIVSILLQRSGEGVGADLSQSLFLRGGGTILHLACARGHADCLRAILSRALNNELISMFNQVLSVLLLSLHSIVRRRVRLACTSLQRITESAFCIPFSECAALGSILILRMR
jgi:ankyrin repeat protein